MISVNEAKELIYSNVILLNPELRPISKAAGHTLAETVFAKIDIPTFPQSSMDGYALKYADINNELAVIGEMAAGAPHALSITSGECARIFTGAPLPNGADTVVMQEKITLSDGKLSIHDSRLQQGTNVRDQGAEIKSGALAMEKGSYLSPAAIGFLAGIGIAELKVYPMPKVSIVVTGKELQKPGLELHFGQVYESNSYSLSAALRHHGIIDPVIVEADDDLEILTQILKTALQQSDVVLLTGGVSVGDYDFVIEASKRCSVTQIFHKVKQKPGKPLYFGKHKNKLIFGLPGNPSSVLSCYYNYVLPALKMLSARETGPKEVSAKLTYPYSKTAGLTHFLKGIYKDGMATPLNAQESFRLSSFAQANCLIQLSEKDENFESGAIINVLLLPD
ncbi:gephyrin-like molybdotransferase Glp [Pedobacter sp. JCM 36344]|uniref:molybdopterin molybdotransferase MoeA n=1 Tax=Pedobacter sp. JCM 36344 TaxID=3374280 RepID=UPI00397B72A9